MASLKRRVKRWATALAAMVKQSKSKKGVTRYTFGDEDDSVAHSESVPAPDDRHRHVDYSFQSGSRPSAQTSYLDLPSAERDSKRPRSSSPPPSLASYDDDTVDWDSGYQDGIDMGYVLNLVDSVDGIDEPTARRRRTPGDRPLLTWMAHVNKYLAELLRLEGRGDHTSDVCAHCRRAGVPRLYRCEDCHTTSLYCVDCTLTLHTNHPLHRIKYWCDGFFHRVTLKALGLRVQLGHEPGDPCTNPKRAFGNDFVVLDTSGIHEVAVDFCNCQKALPHRTQLLRSRWYPATAIDPKTAATFRLLEQFHLMSTQTKVSGWEFYTALARRTENTGVEPPKDRYPSFMLMVRQWRHLKLMKRSGRGHDPTGVDGTSPGECAVECPACPHPGKNLPEDWEKTPPQRSWLYQLFVAMDANFRLKRRKVSNDANDPGLNRGYAYFVEEKTYKDFLNTTNNMATEKHAHCNNHNAVKLANLKNGATLAATGVGAVDCARHSMRRPCSVGDLQKGERYMNMDYLLHNTLEQSQNPCVTASYDIACQYSIHINDRFKTYGFNSLGTRTLRWAIPKFHIAAHREYCRSQFSLHYLPLCGRYDGESIERNWSLINCMAYSTKEMGPGSRRDVLDDAFADQNWFKVTKMPQSFLQKIKTAVIERDRQQVAFEEYTAALPAEQIAQWTSEVERWEADVTQPNPFLATRPAISENAIRKRLLEEDSDALRLGKAVVLHEEFSSSTMLSAGIDLEEQQREHIAELAGMHQHATDLARAKVLQRQNTLHRKLDAWFKVQQLFMPNVSARRTLLMTTPTSHLPHKMPLLLPSTAFQYFECDVKLLEQEWLLREGQAYDALANIRGFLELRAHLYKIKDRFVRGQASGTRSQSAIATVQYKIDMAANRYRAAHDVLTRLSSRLHKDRSGWRVALRPLDNSDLRHAGEDGDATESHRTLSWIWLVSPSAEDAAAGGAQAAQSLQESLRIEWCKARARANRWREECDLLEEEMRRVLAHHEWSAQQWEGRMGRHYANQPDYSEGANAYALRQASIRRSMKGFCENSWRFVKTWMLLGCTGTNQEMESGGEIGESSIDLELPSLIVMPEEDDY